MMQTWFNGRARRQRIFVHRAGRRKIAADPVEVSLALHQHPVYLPQHLDEALAGGRESLQATALAACDVFRVREWQNDRERGLTLAELLETMVAFDGYCETLRCRYEPLADSTALYGGDLPALWRTDYEAFAGLWLNRHRELVRVAEAARLGISGAFGERRLGWFMATAESLEDAVVQFDQHRAEVAQSHAE